MSDRLGYPPADRCPHPTEKCQQLDISASPEPRNSSERDRPLSFRWKADYRTLSEILDLPACKSRRGEKAMASIVHDAALCARENPTRRISYSRRKAFYAAAGRYYGTEYGYDTVVPAVDALVARGLLIDHDKVKGNPRATGTQSSFRPSPQLANITLPKLGYRVGELVRLKDADGHLVAYRDTERTTRDRRFLEAVNGHISQADIRLHGINGAVVDEDAGTIFFPGFMQGFEDGIGDHTVYTRMIALYRVFKGGWNLGGRLYGGWWQQVRSKDRERFLLDGHETVELDHEMLHPRLLYAAVGRRLEHDAYMLDGWDRKVCKRAFNILLNAGSYPKALGAILPYVGENRRAAAKLIADMKLHHSAVANHFHSGVGMRLQNIDSEMAKSVLQELTVRRGIVALPIHDSFIVRREHHDALEEAMDTAFAKAAATVGDCPVGSKVYPAIYPQMERAVLGISPAFVSEPSPVATFEPAISVNGMGIPGEETTVFAHILDVRPSPTDLYAHDLASARGDASASPPWGRHSSETVHRTTIEAVPSLDTPELEDATERHCEALQRANVDSTSPSDMRRPVKAVPMPAFLNPTNRKATAMAELRRLADRPLTDCRTLDLIPRDGRRIPR